MTLQGDAANTEAAAARHAWLHDAAGDEVLAPATSRKISVLGLGYVGKGLQLSIYDAQVNVARLIGANRRFIEENIPHIASVMTSDVAELVREADVLVVATRTPEVVAALQAHTRPEQWLLDVAVLPDREAHRAHYRGVCW